MERFPPNETPMMPMPPEDWERGECETVKYAPDDLESCCLGAQVRREYDVKQYVMNGYPAGRPIQTGASEFFCNDCGRRLAPVGGPSNG